MSPRIHSTKQHTKKSHVATQSNHHTQQSNDQNQESTTMTTAAKSTKSTESVPTTTPADVSYVTPPPTNVVIPAPPTGWVASNAAQYRGVKPKQTELLAMPDAVVELTKFTDYPTTVGKTAPAHQEVLQMFDAASKWSVMRASAAAWDEYCSIQEGMVWTRVRDQMTRMKPAFALAVRGDPSIAAKCPKLASLLEARTAIARKGASTRRMNKVAVAEGKPPIHGAAGKKRKRAADKAVVAQVEAAHAAQVHPASPAANPKVDVAPPQAPAASPAPAPSPQPQATNGATNGASQNGAAHA